jgi:HEAT repeat protein
MSISRRSRLLLGLICLCTSGCGGGSAARLIADLHDDDVQVRRKAARALADSQFADDERVVPALTAATRDADLLVQEAAITSLGQFGALAQSALPELEQAIGSTEPSIRLATALAMSKIDPTTTAFQQVLIESLRSGHAPLFLEVGQLGKNAQWAIPTLVDLLADQQTHVRALSARALGEIGISNDKVDTALKRRLQDREPSVRRAAEAAIEQLRKSASPED